MLQTAAILFDVFLIYADDDKQLAEEILNSLNMAMKRFGRKVKSTTMSEVVNKEATWQYDVVSAMMASSRYTIP